MPNLIGQLKNILYFCTKIFNNCIVKRASKFGFAFLIVITIGMILSVGVNLWLTHLVRTQLDNNIAQNDSIQFSYGDVEVHVLTGKLWIKDVHFCSDTIGWNDFIRPVTEAKVKKLSLDGINYYDWLVNRKIHLSNFSIIHPTFRTRFNHTNEEEIGDELQHRIEEERQKRLEKIMEVARIFVDDAIVDKLTIDQAYVEAVSIDDSLSVNIPECTIQMYDLGYNIKDKIPHYNDSIFHFLFQDINIYIPKVTMSVSVKELRAEPNGILQINNTRISSYINDDKTESIVAGVQTVNIGGFDVAMFNTLKQMDVKNLHLINPFVTLQINESKQTNKKEITEKKQTQDEITAINQKIMNSNLEVVKEFFTGLIIDTISVHDAMINITSISTDFQLFGNHISTSVYGLGYSLIDDIPYHYNDSVFQFHLGHLDMITPNKSFTISANNVQYDNGGSFSIGKTHVGNNIDRWELAHLHGDIPITWMDLCIDTLYTSNKNIVKEARTLGENFFLDTLYAEIDKMTIFRDNRWKVKKPYSLPQKQLLKVKYPFVINCVDASIHIVHLETALSKENIGKIDIGPLQLQLHNVTTVPHSTICAIANGEIGSGNVHAQLDMKVNHSCDWHIQLKASDFNSHYLDSMIYPLMGLTIGCNIHQLTADYGGNSQLAKGTICMVYDNLDIFADKNSNSPYTVVGNLSGLINTANKTIIHKSNPARPGKKPVSYHVEWENDPWANPSMFYLGPLINGCIENFLPGLFLNKRVKDKKSIYPMK